MPLGTPGEHSVGWRGRRNKGYFYFSLHWGLC